MKIADVQIVPFRWKVDRYRNATPMPQTEVMQTVLKIVTDEGLEGYYFGGGSHGDEEGLPEHSRQMILGRVRSMLVGQDPLDREKIWKWLWVMNAPEHVTGVIDMALWDLAGSRRAAGPQAARGSPREGQGVRQHLPEHGAAGELRRARAGLQAPGVHGVQDPPVLLLGPGHRGGGPQAGRRTSSGTSSAAGPSAKPSATTWC